MSTLRFKRLVIGSWPGGILMRMRQQWNTWRTLRTNPERGSTAMQDVCTQLILPRLGEPGEVFIDIGAHIGSVLARVLAHDSAARIIAIEAVPMKAEFLQRRFPQIVVHSCALGDEEGTASFFVDPDRPGYSALSRGTDAERIEIEVPIHRLDSLVPIEKRVGMMKIDVEGAELAVLRGAKALLQRWQPAICFESASLGDDVERIFELLTRRGYELYVPNRVAHEGPPLCLESFIESHHYPRRTTDYFAIHCERRQEYRRRARRILGIPCPDQ